MFFDRNDFDCRCKEVISDVNNQKITSPAWGWITVGAAMGFIASCLRIKRKETKPILASYKKVTGEVKDGQPKR
jgi:hypothetical protein